MKECVGEVPSWTTLSRPDGPSILGDEKIDPLNWNGKSPLLPPGRLAPLLGASDILALLGLEGLERPLVGWPDLRQVRI